MKAFNRILASVIIIMIVILASGNMILSGRGGNNTGRPYRVEVSRLVSHIEENGYGNLDLSRCEYVTDVVEYGDDFYNTPNDYIIREINGVLYRFDYRMERAEGRAGVIAAFHIILFVMFVFVICVMFYIKFRILKPFEELSEFPCQLSRGNLLLPLKENKSRFFGKFVWGMDMLRDNMERQKRRELDLQREKKMLLLSLSHDIKTPLSAIKLYAKALSRELYDSRGKQREIAESINEKADEIAGYISRIVTASREDFLSPEVCMGEFYLSALVTRIRQYYDDKLSLVKISFAVGEYPDCLLKADLERSVEVLQNVMENAIKYGDGGGIGISFSQEEDCVLIAVENRGCTLSDKELPHIFESFWRGANAAGEKGSGLGLFICRQLMRKMDGEAYAEVRENRFIVVLVFRKA